MTAARVRARARVRSALLGLALVGTTAPGCRRADPRETDIRKEPPRQERLVADVAPFGMVVADDVLYFTDRHGERVARVATSGGAVTTLAASPWPIGLAVADHRAIWSDYAGNGSVRAASTNGGPVVDLATGRRLGGMSFVATNGRALFWTDDEQVVTAALDGSNPTPLHTARAERRLGNLAVGSTWMAWSERTGTDEVMLARRIDDPSDAPVPLRGAPRGASAVTFEGDDAYAMFGDAAVHRFAFATGEATTIALPPRAAGYFHVLALDADAFYVAGVGSGASPKTHDVLKLPRAGGAPIPIATASGSYVGALAVDGTHVYWTTNDEIWRARK